MKFKTYLIIISSYFSLDTRSGLLLNLDAWLVRKTKAMS